MTHSLTMSEMTVDAWVACAWVATKKPCMASVNGYNSELCFVVFIAYHGLID